MDIFKLDQALIGRYETFARSFSEIRAPEIRAQVDAAYAGQHFWPEPLITINPSFEAGASVDELVAQNVLDPALNKIFAAGRDRKPIKFGGATHRVWMKELPAAGASQAIELPMDASFELRAQAAHSLWRTLCGRSPGPLPSGFSQQRRQRFALVLRALDGRNESESYRAIAEGLFGKKRIPERAWKTHDLRNRHHSPRAARPRLDARRLSRTPASKGQGQIGP